MTMELDLTFIVLAVLLLGGSVAALRKEIERRHQRKLEIAQGPQPVCGCRHHYAYHSPKTGSCAAVSKTPVRWDRDFGSPTRWEHLPCTCQRYVGPEPLETLYMPEITSSYIKDDEGPQA